jgi:hypothetical protein
MHRSSSYTNELNVAGDWWLTSYRSYSGGRDKEDCGWKFVRSYLEKTNHKKWLAEWLKR